MFYDEVLAKIHDEQFGTLAVGAAELVRDLLHERGHTHGTVVDLGCGSGIFAAAMVDAGYDVVGIDVSADMLRIAQRRAPSATFRCESVIDAALPDAIAITAIGEVLNYGHDARMLDVDLTPLFARVRAALAPGGVFVFDVASAGRVGPTGARDSFHEADDWTLTMHAAESDDRTRLDRHITVFHRADGECFHRVHEHHVLRLLEPHDVQQVLEACGFAVERRGGYGGSSAGFMPEGEGWSVFVATAR